MLLKMWKTKICSDLWAESKDYSIPITDSMNYVALTALSTQNQLNTIDEASKTDMWWSWEKVHDETGNERDWENKMLHAKQMQFRHG